MCSTAPTAKKTSELSGHVSVDMNILQLPVVTTNSSKQAKYTQ